MSTTMVRVALVLLGIHSVSTQAATIYVDQSNQSGNEDGDSWATAYTKLWQALDRDGLAPGDEIWVAEGVYKPPPPCADPPCPETPCSTTNGKDCPFVVDVGGLKLYGGFPAGGSAFENRDPVAYQTFLSGDIGGNDGAPPFDWEPYVAQGGWDPDCPPQGSGWNIPGRRDNAWHVMVVSAPAGTTFELDGFIVHGGTAHVVHSPQGRYLGAGIWIQNGTVNTIANCTFRDNYCIFAGAAVFVNGGTTTFTDCTFENNFAQQFSNIYSSGGAVAIIGGTASFGNCEFNDNRASWWGSAVFVNAAEVAFEDCSFTRNHASYGLTSDPCNWDGQGGYPERGYVAGGGAIGAACGTITADRCSFTENEGGAYAEGYWTTEFSVLGSARWGGEREAIPFRLRRRARHHE